MARVDLGAVLESVGSGPAAAGPDRTASVDRMLDAALGCYVERGMRATTMADVAEAAGVSRVWLHKVVGSRDELVHAVLTREVERVLGLLVELTPLDPDPVVAFGDAAGVVVAHFASHPLVRRLVDDEADQVVGAFTDGRFLGIVSARVAAMLGLFLGVPADAARPLAEAATRVSVSLMIAPTIPGGDTADAVAALFAAAFGPTIRSLTGVTPPPG